jgi:hypothetical protein
MKGLTVDILKTDGKSCSNFGISSRCDRATMIGPEIVELFEADEKRPAIRLVKRNLSDGVYIHAVPVGEFKGTGPMFGGCFIYSSDSRFREISKYPIPLHDRFE